MSIHHSFQLRTNLLFVHELIHHKENKQQQSFKDSLLWTLHLSAWIRTKLLIWYKATDSKRGEKFHSRTERMITWCNFGFFMHKHCLCHRTLHAIFLILKRNYKNKKRMVFDNVVWAFQLWKVLSVIESEYWFQSPCSEMNIQFRYFLILHATTMHITQTVITNNML